MLSVKGNGFYTMLFVQPFLELSCLFLAYHDILVIASLQSDDKFGIEEQTDFPDAFYVGNVLSVDAEKLVGV